MPDKTPSSLPPLPAGYDNASYADRREQFEQLSNNATKDPDAEHAFLTNKIELIRNDSNLSDEERHRAIVELQSRIDGLKKFGNPHPDGGE